MNILYLSMSYSLKDDGLYQNLVEALLNKGHNITIVRSDSNIGDTYFEKISPQFNVLNVKTQNVFSSNLIAKGMAQVMLPYYFKTAIDANLSKHKYDLVLYATPPVTLANVVEHCKKKYNAKTFLMLKDIFPQNAVDLKMLKKGSLVYKYFRYQEKRYYNLSDYIGCMSQGNVEYVKKHNNIDFRKLHVFPNSIKIDREYNPVFNKEKTKFMFGGNLGRPQNIPLLLEIINGLKDYSKAEFCIIGSGTETNKIEEFLSNHRLKNVTYKRRLPKKEYEDILNTADVGIISLDPRFTIPNIPSKSQSYWKLGKPIFAFTDKNTDLKDMILDHDCGWWCDASNYNQIIETIKCICENKEMQIEKGKNGYCYLRDAFDVKRNVSMIEDFLNK